MVKITHVENDSKAQRAGIRVGDLLDTVNKNAICDVLDYRFYLTEKKVKIGLVRDGKRFTVKIKKGEYEEIGLEFETPLMDKKHSCKNGCIFCFIDQNPKGMRDTVYFKDDDSRLSFIHGNYVTLTNMTEGDVDRIIKMRMSPINVSIHTTNPLLRVKMMKNKRAGEVLSYLGRFAEAGISLCGQIVLCRGVNDGDELLRTMQDLSRYYPSLGSVSVVPAGLTKHREGLYPLSDFTADEAGKIIDMVESFSCDMLDGHGSRVFYAADELYLKAGRKIPPAECYEGYPQLENGVGLIRSFSDELCMAEEDISELLTQARLPRRVSIATGAASYGMMRDFSARLMAIVPNLQINVYKIINRFFGETITVAGLLTGKDICEQLRGRELFDELLVPAAAVRPDDNVFLCGMSVKEMEAALNVPVRTCECDGYEFVKTLLGVSHS